MVARFVLGSLAVVAAVASIGCRAPALTDARTAAPARTVEASTATPPATSGSELRLTELRIGDLALGGELPPASCRDLFFYDAPVWIVAHGNRGDAGIQALVKYCLAKASKNAPALRLAALRALEAEPSAAIDHLAAGYLSAELAYEGAESYGSACMWWERSNPARQSYKLPDFAKRLADSPDGGKALAHFRAAASSGDEIGWFASFALLRLGSDMSRPERAVLDALAQRMAPRSVDPDARFWLVEASKAWHRPEAETAFRTLAPP